MARFKTQSIISNKIQISIYFIVSHYIKRFDISNKWIFKIQIAKLFQISTQHCNQFDILNYCQIGALKLQNLPHFWKLSN